MVATGLLFFAFGLCALWCEEEEAEAVEVAEALGLASIEPGAQGDWDCDMSKINLKKKFKATLYSMTWWALTIDYVKENRSSLKKGTYSDALVFSLFLINISQFFVFG